jgi:hypothetical protein
LSLFLWVKPAAVANVSFLAWSFSLSLFIPPPTLIDREQSPSSKQESDAAEACLAWNGTHTQTYSWDGMGLWQRLGHQSGHCFNDHCLFSSLASPSTAISSLTLPSWYQGTTLSSHCGWTLIYWAFGISETQLPKLHVQGMAMAVIYFIRNHSWFGVLMPLLGVSCYFLLPGMRHSLSALQGRQQTEEGTEPCLISNPSR